MTDYLRVLRERRGLVLACVLLAAAAAFAYSLVKDPTYTAVATISPEDPGEQAGKVLGQQSADFFPQGDTAAGASRVTRDDVVNAVSEKTKVPPDDLKSDVDTSVDIVANLVEIEAKGDTGEQAAQIANAFAEQTKLQTKNEARKFYKDAARSLGDSVTDEAVRQRLETLQAVADPVDIVKPAEVPSSPSSPRPIRDTIIAAVLGLLIGVGVAFLRHSLDRRITDAHQLQKQLGMPLVGYVRAETLGMVGISANGATGASEDDLEAFRILRTNVDFLAKDQTLHTIAVTSPLPEEGKSTVAAWYAYANAVAGRRTVLVECDFRRPVLADRFGFDGTPGLSDYLAGDVRPGEVLRSVNVEGPAAEPLPVIPAGENAFQPAEMIASQRFHDFLAQIAKAYELVVIDSAPLLPVGDTLELLPQVDGALFCVRMGQTTHDQAAAAYEAMAHLPPRPTGLVVTGLERGSEDDYYGYYSSYTAKNPRAGAVG